MFFCREILILFSLQGNWLVEYYLLFVAVVATAAVGVVSCPSLFMASILCRDTHRARCTSSVATLKTILYFMSTFWHSLIFISMPNAMCTWLYFQYPTHSYLHDCLFLFHLTSPLVSLLFPFLSFRWHRLCRDRQTATCFSSMNSLHVCWPKWGKMAKAKRGEVGRSKATTTLHLSHATRPQICKRAKCVNKCRMWHLQHEWIMCWKSFIVSMLTEMATVCEWERESKREIERVR